MSRAKHGATGQPAAEDKRKALPRPADYVPPPPPSAADVGRTLVTLATSFLPMVARLALDRDLLSSDTAEGLAAIRPTMARALRRLAIDLEVLHAERVPREGGLILMWNQESHLDHLVLPVAIPRPFISLYNNEIARLPLYGAHMRRTGHLHVDRTDETQWRASVARAAARAQEGGCILISPEGTRSWDGKLLPMKRGAFLLAEAAAKPIVCVTVIGGHDRLPRGSPWARGGRIRVVFSQPLTPTDHPGERREDLVTATFQSLKEQYRIGTGA